MCNKFNETVVEPLYLNEVVGRHEYRGLCHEKAMFTIHNIVYEQLFIRGH